MNFRKTNANTPSFQTWVLISYSPYKVDEEMLFGLIEYY